MIDSTMLDQNPLKRNFTDMITSSRQVLDDDDNDAKKTAVSDTNSKEFTPRSYQLKVFGVAMKRNTIAVLETGSGKTMIAVMLIKQVGQAIKSSGNKKLIVFLAPTVHLVKQQHEVIRSYTDFEVGEYSGAKGVDEWTLKNWEKEIDEHDVLLDALRKAFLNLELVSMIIIDECHRATGNHPYTKIMKEFYYKLGNKPKVFGMTASPVVRKGVSSVTDCEGQISELERILDSQVYSIKDRTEMDAHISSAKEICRFYNKAQFCSLDLKSKIETSWSKFDATVINLRESIQNGFRDVDDKIKTLRKRLSKDRIKILNCLEDLGLFCAYEAVKICLERISKLNEECEAYGEISHQCKYFLEEVLSIICESLPRDDKFSQSELDYTKATDLGYISPKLHELLQLLSSLGAAEEVLCLIFVEKIITAKVTERVVKKVASLAQFTVSYMTGTNSSGNALPPKMQNEILDNFRSGKVNLLFTTDVLEEGIHVPNCSYVIRFDLPKTVRSYVQSRGRARQNNSHFITMLERGNVTQRNQLFDITRSEWSMTNTAFNRNPDIWTLKGCITGETKGYVVDSTGASVTADSSVSLIYQYCEKLPGDRYYAPRPIFDFELCEKERGCKCKITFPPNATFQTMVGPVAKSKQLAKQLACLEACKKLHQEGALNDHLLPSNEDKEENPIMKSKEMSAGAGTTKRKELHGTACVRALSGSWGEKLDGATFYAYKFDFSCSIVSEKYSGFVLLIESKLDHDVGNIELDLYLRRKTVKASVSSCGQMHLDSQQMMKAKCFQEFLFNGLFGKLFVGSKSSGKQREFLIKNDTRELWSSSNLYLLLPLDILTSNHEPWRINWLGLDSCCNVVGFLKKNSCISAVNRNIDGSESQQTLKSSVSKCCDASLICLANSMVNVNDLKNIVVVAIHTGRMYSVVEVASNMTAESSFEQSADYSTFADYFNKKYDIVLMHPEQPLLRLKQSHNTHNLLVDFNDKGASKEGKVVKPQQHVHIPPELLVRVDIPFNILKSCYLLPSLMHRLESLMLAGQLRQEIGYSAPDFQISSSLVLEAITTVGCCENFSMERLELLGDSVLKYAISCHLFLRFQKKHEGQLTSWRSRVICNAELHKLGIDRKVQGYIRDCAFDPRRWFAPGQRSLHPVPCKCGIDTLEVPLDAKFQTEDPKIRVGKSCDMGHRWMGSKTISDCVEAIIGAYYVSGGLGAAVYVLKWLGIDIELDHSFVVETITAYSLRSYIPKESEVRLLESKLGYTFSIKFLLQEAMTHASLGDGTGYCYQRLEFLGDSVLDLLITSHLYQSHIDIDPGMLTDLRSASVNNDNFARVAVRHGLYKHLLHSSTVLLSQMTEYARCLNEYNENNTLSQGQKGPKALGDLVESIAGAMLIDTKLNLDDVWSTFKPLLSPITTPEKLELPPRRELSELCDSLGYFMKEKFVTIGDMVHVELRVQLNDTLLVEKGSDHKRKVAAGKAASLLLKQLEDRGISYSRGGSKKRKLDSNNALDYSLELANQSVSTLKDSKRTKLENEQPAVSSNGALAPADYHRTDIPVVDSISQKKGGPRTTLFDLCKKLQWPMPTFKTQEKKSRKAMEIGEGTNKRTGFNSFVSTVTLNIPGSGVVECSGDPRADKKSSYDSAALLMLYKLQGLRQIVIYESCNSAK